MTVFTISTRASGQSRVRSSELQCFNMLLRHFQGANGRVFKKLFCFTSIQDNRDELNVFCNATALLQ